MSGTTSIRRTSSEDADFHLLIRHLDHELWNELNEDQATYDQYNKVPDIKTAILVYMDGVPAGSGCFKAYNEDTIEIKRMFVEKQFRGRGIARIILSALEQWASEEGFLYAILETSVHFRVARRLYENSGYLVIPNYDQYAELPESVCMKKRLA